jgi:hypothetical protein
MAELQNGGVSDVKLRWPHIINRTITNQRRGTDPFPTLAALHQGMVERTLDHGVLIRVPEGETVYEIRDWLDGHAARYTIYARYEWADHGIRVTRDLKGLVFAFDDEDMAVFFKFRWASGV